MSDRKSGFAETINRMSEIHGSDRVAEAARNVSRQLLEQALSPNVPTVVEDDALVFVKIVNGKIRCSIGLLEDSPEYEKLVESIDRANEISGIFQDTLVLNFTFAPAAILDFLIDGHQMYGQPGRINGDGRQEILQLRKELVQMVERIDALEFVEARD